MAATSARSSRARRRAPAQILGYRNGDQGVVVIFSGGRCVSETGTVSAKVYERRGIGGALMKRAIVSVAMLAAGLATASAADIRPVRKAPPPPAPIVYSWSGIYVGGHIGHGWGRWSSRTRAGSATHVRSSGAKFRPDPRGWVGGAQLGFNWQLAPNWVVGVEADISWADANVSDNAPITTTAGVVLAGSNQFTTRDLEMAQHCARPHRLRLGPGAAVCHRRRGLGQGNLFRELRHGGGGLPDRPIQPDENRI